MALSTRGSQWATRFFMRGDQNFWDPDTNPQGLVTFLNSENWLLRDKLAEYVKTHNVLPDTFCSYREGYTGTKRLRAALANHLNTYFKPHAPVDADMVAVAAGVTALDEAITMAVCDPGQNDAIMLGRPNYGGFFNDLFQRTGVGMELVGGFGDVDQFTADAVQVYERALEDAKQRGVNVRALIIVNPHNPLGRCYTRDAMVALLKFCAKHNLHFISDEIYGWSVYERLDAGAETEVLTSALSLDLTGIIDPSFVHVLYGMSKDLGCAGLRLGCLISRNKKMINAVCSMCRYMSPSDLSSHFAITILEDQEFMSSYLSDMRTKLSQARKETQDLLQEAGIKTSHKGNGGLYVYVDLSSHLPLDAAKGDQWVAESLLTQRLLDGGVMMSSGAGYHDERAGWYRLVFTLPAPTVKEGIRRIALTLSSKS